MSKKLPFLVAVTVNNYLRSIFNEIEKSLQCPIDSYKFVAEKESNVIKLEVFKNDGTTVIQTYDSSLLSGGIRSMSNLQLSKDDDLKYVVCKYDRTNSENNFVDIYYTNKEGEKEAERYTY